MGVLKNKIRDRQKLPTWLFFFPAMLLKLFSVTLFRVRYDDRSGVMYTARGYVSVTWHNRLLYFPALFPKCSRLRTRAVVSASRDGQYVADLISFFGIRSLRGSSKKRGAHALLGAVRALEEGDNVSFTPDGPRGPKYRMSRGPVHLASTQHAAILPISINASRYWQIRSWDNFQIPKPFSTLTVVMGEPVSIPECHTEEELEAQRLRVEQALMAITVD